MKGHSKSTCIHIYMAEKNVEVKVTTVYKHHTNYMSNSRVKKTNYININKMFGELKKKLFYCFKSRMIIIGVQIWSLWSGGMILKSKNRDHWKSSSSNALKNMHLTLIVGQSVIQHFCSRNQTKKIDPFRSKINQFRSGDQPTANILTNLIII